MNKLMEQSHRCYEILGHVNCAKYYSFGGEDRIKEPSEKEFPGGLSECN